MEINEKLVRPITEVSYLRADNADRYRIIIRYFYEEYEKIHYWLYKEDIYEMLMQTNRYPNYTMETCMSDLQFLVNWGNLTAVQDTAKVHSLEEFYNRKYRYQLNEYTIEIERMTIRLENLEIEGASLEPSLLERIRHAILDLPHMIDKSDKEVSSWWNDLNNDFIRLNRNYQDYIRTLNSAQAEKMMLTQEFLIFKDKIIQYLRSFVKELQEKALILEPYIKDIPQDTITTILHKVVAYEMSIPRIDIVLNESELYAKSSGRWNSLYHWFVGEHEDSEVSKMSDITNDIIRKITRYAQQIGELHNQGANKTEEYRHLANLFGKCSSLEDAHRMSAMVFGVDQCLHFRNLHNRMTDSIDSGVYEEDAMYYDLEYRTRIAAAKSKRKPAVDYSLEKEMEKLRIMEQQEQEQRRLQTYIHKGIIAFQEISYLDATSRKILLDWLSKGLASPSHRARTQWGESFTVDDTNRHICKITCEDGNFFMPAFRIVFDRKEENV